MNAITASILILLASAMTTDASTNGQDISGEVFDDRIDRCGVIVTQGNLATLRPFIETSLPLAGTVRLQVSKRSAGGTSRTSQSWAFADGSLGNSSVRIDLPATVSIEMTVTDASGIGLCRVSRNLALDQNNVPA